MLGNIQHLLVGGSLMFAAKATGTAFVAAVGTVLVGGYIDYPFSWISPTWSYVFRYVCIVIAAITGGLTLSCLRYSLDKYQSAQFIGLGMFCLAFIYGTMSRMGGPITPRLPLYLLALLMTLYGYRGWLRQHTRTKGEKRGE